MGRGRGREKGVRGPELKEGGFRYSRKICITLKGSRAAERSLHFGSRFPDASKFPVSTDSRLLTSVKSSLPLPTSPRRKVSREHFAGNYMFYWRMSRSTKTKNGICN